MPNRRENILQLVHNWDESLLKSSTLVSHNTLFKLRSKNQYRPNTMLQLYRHPTAAELTVVRKHDTSSNMLGYFFGRPISAVAKALSNPNQPAPNKTWAQNYFLSIKVRSICVRVVSTVRDGHILQPCVSETIWQQGGSSICLTKMPAALFTMFCPLIYLPPGPNSHSRS